MAPVFIFLLLLTSLQVVVVQSYLTGTRLSCATRYGVTRFSAAADRDDQKKSPLEREKEVVEKGLSHIKYNKYAPTPEEAKNMSSDEFRATIYKRMKEAEMQRRREQGNKVGGAVSDDYLESLGGGSKNIAAALIVAGFVSLSAGLDIASAQTPNMDQYNQGSGSYVGKRTAPSPQVANEVIGKVNSYADLNAAIKTIRTYVSNQNWNDVILVIDQVKAGISRGVLKDSLKDDFLFYIDQVNDVAVENRVLFFNKEDLEQVQMIKDAGSAAAERSSAAIGEALHILDDVVKLFEA